jgi:hypothetical protein
VLDVYTSRWFGNAPTKKGFEPALEFLQRSDVEPWLAKTRRTPENCRRQTIMDRAAGGGDRAGRGCGQALLSLGTGVSRSLLCAQQPGGQDVQLREEAGFDAVVGNPPWGRRSKLRDDRLVLYLRSFRTKERRGRNSSVHE